MTDHDNALTIRDASRADAMQIANWNTAMALETEALSLEPATILAGVEGLFEDPARGFYLVAEVDGKAAGTAMVTREWSDWRNGEFWWVQSVYVDPEFRRRGIYSALYAQIQERAPANVVGFRLYVEQENTRAQATYERLGMSSTHYRLYEHLR